MEATYPLSNAPAEQKPSPYGTASLVFAGLTVVLPVVVGLLTGYRINQSESHPQGGLEAVFLMILGVMAAVAVAGVSGLVGTLTAVVALVRSESQKWRPIVGLVVNAPVAVFVLYLVAVWTNKG